MAIPTVVSPTVVASARSRRAAAKTSAAPPVASSVRITVRPFQRRSPLDSRGASVTLRETTLATRPFPVKSEAAGATSAISPPIAPRKSSTIRWTPRRLASSTALRNSSAVARVIDGTVATTTSRSQRVDRAGASNRARGIERVTLLSSPPRNRMISTWEPSGPSSAALTFQSDELRTGFLGWRAGQGRDNVGEAATAREHDAEAEGAGSLLRPIGGALRGRDVIGERIERIGHPVVSPVEKRFRVGRLDVILPRERENVREDRESPRGRIPARAAGIGDCPQGKESGQRRDHEQDSRAVGFHQDDGNRTHDGVLPSFPCHPEERSDEGSALLIPRGGSLRFAQSLP